jgi:hypothetical protein
LCFVLHFPDMARYYFNVHNGAPSVNDGGTELQDDEAAWRQATTTAGELFKDIDGKFQPDQEWSLEVTDERRKPISADARRIVVQIRNFARCNGLVR